MKTFTRIDLITSALCLFVLSSLGLAAVKNQHSGSHALVCMQNVRQLVQAWQGYAHDHEGRFPIPDEQNPDAVYWIGTSTKPSSRYPFTEELINPELSIANSPLNPYLPGAYSVWRCPSDTSKASSPNYKDGKPQPLVRSYSMNNWINGSAWGGGMGGTWKLFKKMSDITELSPSELFVIMDERADSINDENLLVDMAGFLQTKDENTLASGGRSYRIVDYPAHYHDQSAVVGFADGSVRLQTWLDARTIPPMVENRALMLNVPSPGNPDVRWLQWHATRKPTTNVAED